MLLRTCCDTLFAHLILNKTRSTAADWLRTCQFKATQQSVSLYWSCVVLSMGDICVLFTCSDPNHRESV